MSISLEPLYQSSLIFYADPLLLWFGLSLAALRYILLCVLPVLWTTSLLVIVGHMAMLRTLKDVVSRSIAHWGLMSMNTLFSSARLSACSL